MRKTTKLIAVLSAAAMMAVSAPNVMRSSFLMEAYAAENGWVEEDGGWHFYDEDGYMESNTWKKRGNDWYYLNDDGDVTVNERVDEYYVDGDGKMVKNKWVSPEGEETYDSPDSAADTEWNYFDKNGKIVTSKWMSVNNNWYYFDGDGIMQTGLLELDGETYYLGAENDGARRTGWVLLEEITEDTDDEGIWCYFDQDGKLVKDQIDRKIDGFYYTFKDGQMQTGWVNMKGENSRPESINDYKYFAALLTVRKAAVLLRILWLTIDTTIRSWAESVPPDGMLSRVWKESARRARNTTSTLRTENPTTLRPKVWNSSISIPSAMPLMKKERCRRDFRNSQLRTAQRPITTSATTVS